MKHGKEKWQAHMNRVGGSMLREETAELSQRFAQFGGATLKSKGWKRGLEDGFVTYTKTINGNRNVISQWPGFWQGDDGGTPTPELPPSWKSMRGLRHRACPSGSSARWRAPTGHRARIWKRRSRKPTPTSTTSPTARRTLRASAPCPTRLDAPEDAAPRGHGTL